MTQLHYMKLLVVVYILSELMRKKCCQKWLKRMLWAGAHTILSFFTFTSLLFILGLLYTCNFTSFPPQLS
jgi:hypothetical protein